MAKPKGSNIEAFKLWINSGERGIIDKNVILYLQTLWKFQSWMNQQELTKQSLKDNDIGHI